MFSSTGMVWLRMGEPVYVAHRNGRRGLDPRGLASARLPKAHFKYGGGPRPHDSPLAIVDPSLPRQKPVPWFHHATMMKSACRAAL